MDSVRLGRCEDLIKQIPDNSIDLIIIDPPYEFTSGKGSGAFGNKNRKYHREYYSVGEDIPLEKPTVFDISIFDEFIRVLKQINIYVWCSKKMLSKVLVYFEDHNCATDVITWHKTNPTPTCNNTYLSDTEYLVFAREKGVKVYGSYQTKKKWYLSPTNKSDKKKYQHPTIKPLDITQNIIINSSKEGDIVLDAYMGSGTTAVACVRTGRHFIGFDNNEDYVKIANDRIDEERKYNENN